MHDLLFVNTDEMEVQIGNSTSKNTNIILTMHGKPIIWFEPPSLNGEPSKLCAIFNDKDGTPISYINRNQFTALTSNQDIRSKSTKLSIVSNNKQCLVLSREGDDCFKIIKMENNYLKASVRIVKDGSTLISIGESTMTLSGVHAEACGSAFNVGRTPSNLKYNKLRLALHISKKDISENVYNLKGVNVGWFVVL